MLRPVLVEDHSSITVVRFNRPTERNSLSVATLEKLEKIVTAVTGRSEVEAVIFTGVDDVFASGADIRELAELTKEEAGVFAERGQRLFQKIADLRQFTVAAINGYCMGGGLDLALACDARCASKNAVFAHPGARLGIITGWGGTQRLPRLVGAARAMEMFTAARRINATEALDIGLVNRVGDSALSCAFKIALEAISQKKMKTTA